MADTAIATAADYADAMLVARRAKNWLVLILLLALLAQLGLFFTARYTDLLTSGRVHATDPTTLPMVEPATQPGTVAGRAQDAAAAAVNAVVPRGTSWADMLHYVLGATAFLGVTLGILLSLVLLLIVTIMLVGRLIGVSRVTSAYVWCLVLILMMFPWQAFLRDADLRSREFIIPGVLYTWDELHANAKFATSPLPDAALKWARFVGFPVVAVLILMTIQVKSNRGLRQALGEDDFALSTTPS